MAKVTNRDIAERAGVSPAAVSMAIHGQKGISEETRARILKVVQEMNYLPPTHISSDTGSDTIILVGDNLSHQITGDLMASLLDCASRQNAELHFYTTAQFLDNPLIRLTRCILLITFDELDRSTLDRITPLVPKILVIDGMFSRKPLYNIRMDYSGAAYTLTKYLADLGHRNIAYINQDFPASKNLAAFSGFQRLLLELHLPLNPVQIVMDAENDPNVWSHLPDIVRSNNISAIVCTSDRAAVHAYNLMQQTGLRIPTDISIACLVRDTRIEHPGFTFTQVSLHNEAISAELSSLFSKSKSFSDSRDLLIPAGSVSVGDSTDAPSFNPKLKKLAIALILKEHPTYRVVRAGFLNKIQQLGYQAEVVGITDTDENAFRQTCLSVRHSGVDGLVMWYPLPDVIRELSKAGIAVVCPHSISPDGERYGLRASIASNPELIAENVADFFAEKFSDRSGVIAVSQSEDTEQESSVIRALISRMKELCPQIEVRTGLYFTNNSPKNVAFLADFIRATPDLLGAYTTAGDTVLAWADAKKDAAREDMVIVGTDYTDGTLERIENGDVDAFVAQPLYEEAQMSVHALDEILRGNDFPYLTTLDAPLVTRQNVDRYVRLLQDVNNWYV